LSRVSFLFVTLPITNRAKNEEENKQSARIHHSFTKTNLVKLYFLFTKLKIFKCGRMEDHYTKVAFSQRKPRTEFIKKNSPTYHWRSSHTKWKRKGEGLKLAHWTLGKHHKHEWNRQNFVLLLRLSLSTKTRNGEE